MSVEYMMEKLVIDLKAAIDDIDKLVAEPNLYKWDQARLLNLRDDIIASRIGARAKSELEDDRRREGQGDKSHREE